ncbi:MAG: YwiC-like family protein [Actinobacteria bacterium]|nr:YwiC-like family protein [Actinomycetota bacterium]MCB9411787.1 YwiC-like family protein [Actinomycetota bacterium]
MNVKATSGAGREAAVGDQPGAGAAEESAPTTESESRAAATAATAAAHGTARRRRTWTSYIPPQHGAWAFLVVPLAVGFTTVSFSWVALLFGAAWIVAYPVGYFGGRALATRIRRGSWTRLARREAGRAVPWAVALAVLGVPLVVLRPWLVAVAVVVATIWGVSLLITLRESERALSNDVVLVVLSMVAVPTVWAISVAEPGGWPELPPLPVAVGWATAATGVFLFGTVLHVRSLLREAGNRRFHWLSVGYHVVALVGFALVTPWWVVGFTPALVRAVALRPGLRPAVIGAIESVMSLFFVIAAVLAG